MARGKAKRAVRLADLKVPRGGAEQVKGGRKKQPPIKTGGPAPSPTPTPTPTPSPSSG
jgi:hypothetical protein